MTRLVFKSDWMKYGRLFQAAGPTWLKARSPNLDFSTSFRYWRWPSVRRKTATISSELIDDLSRPCSQVAGWCEWGASGSTVSKWSAILLEASINASELQWCIRCNGLMVDSGINAWCECSVAIVESAAKRRIWSKSPQLKDAAVDNSTDELLHRQLVVEVDAKNWYDHDRLDDVITDWERQLSRRQLATAEPLLLRLKRIQLESTCRTSISNVSYATAQFVNVRNLARSEGLFVVSVQVMTDKFACENLKNGLGLCDEFHWT